MLRRSLCAGVLFIASIFPGACETSQPDQVSRRRTTGPNILLITLDTTRADRLGCYGYAEAQTPAMDALAAEGVRFDQAFCQVPLTLPSHTSLLTGTCPPTHGIRINAGGVLGDDVPTLAEALHASGYRTGAFVGAWVLNATFGLGRGFDHYDDDLGGETVEPSIFQERTADAVCDAALDWLGQDPQAPFFAWVHFFDAHAPYNPPLTFRQKLSDPYDGEIAFVDTQVRRLIDWLEQNQLRQRTLVVVAGDHGEAFGEHGEVEHGLLLYDDTTRVPLIFSWPSRLPPGVVEGVGVRLIDVAPTVLELAECERTAGLQGESLRPALLAEPFASLPAYGETDYPRIGFGWASLRSYTTDQWKYIDAPRPELYDRVNDPGELTNVADQHPHIVSQLKTELVRFLAGLPRHKAADVPADPETIRALESLGYVGITAAPEDSDDGRPRRNPADMVHVYRGLIEAKGLLQQRRYVEVVAMLEPLAAQSPESDELFGTLGEAYLQLGRLPEAERAYRASLRAFPDNPYKLVRLGDALHRQNKINEAMSCFQRAVALAPNYDHAHNRLGTIYFQTRQFDKAYEHLRKDLELNPTSANAMTNVAMVLPNLGRVDEAIDLLKKAIECDATFAPAHRVLWQLLLSRAGRTEAIAALRSACEALPDDVALRRNLAGLLATTPKAGPGASQEAIRLAQQCCQAEPNEPENFDVLGIAYASAGDSGHAAEAARKALELAEEQGRSDLAAQIVARLQAYQRGQPH
jgi:arylsulfatase A-like enzyme/tetratricopeptide (TPR) repeat protein